MTKLNKMEKFNLSEWLKDKSHKVVTRSGIEVEIIHDENPLVAIINGVAYNFDNDGKFQSNKSNHKYDLFFADEVEKELKAMIQDIERGDFTDESFDFWKGRLLGLARKEIEKDIEEGAVEFAKSYMEDVNPSFEKVQESEELWKWKMSCLKGVNKAYTNGKQDALKDLPTWKKANDNLKLNAIVPHLLDDVLYWKGYYIWMKDLENLPKEE